MRMLIIVFSQTGYTQKVAECIRDGAIEMGTECELAAISDVDPSSLHEYDLIGLGCPVFYGKEPLNVRWFVERLPEMKGKHWFIFTTHASTIGIAMIAMARGLESKGAVIVGSHDTYADSTAPFIPYPTLTTGHPDEQEYEEARVFGKDLVDLAQRIADGDTGLIPSLDLVSEEFANVTETFPVEFMEQTFPKLQIDREKCVQCHTCEETCPAKGIAINPDSYSIQNPCIYCFRCVMVCPEIAIDAVDSEWGMLLDMIPSSYELYRKRLDEAAARGEFRWLMDPDSIDFEDTMLKQRRRNKEKA
jgi:ferredoxin